MNLVHHAIEATDCVVLCYPNSANTEQFIHILKLEGHKMTIGDVSTAWIPAQRANKETFNTIQIRSEEHKLIEIYTFYPQFWN